MGPLLEKKAQWGGPIAFNITTMKKTITLLLMMCVAAIALADDNTVTINHNAIVLWQQGPSLYLKYEEEGDYVHCLVYGNVGQTYFHGDVIPAGFGGETTIYDGESEITQPFGFQPPIGHVEVIPDNITVPDINHDNWAHFVLLKQVTVSDLTNNSFKITDADGNEAVGYNKFSQNVQNGYYEELTGIVGSYGRYETIYQLLPIIMQDTEINCLEDLYEQPSGQICKIRLKAIYQNGRYMYLQDFCDQFGLLYGNVGINARNGDVIEGTCTWSTYAGNIQLNSIGDWEVISHGPAVEPVEVTIEELSIDMVHWYVKIYDVEFVEDISPNTCMMVDPTGEISVYNRFNINIPFNNLKDGWEPRLDVNHDGEVNIADVNCVIDMIIGGGHSMNYRKYVIGFVGAYRGELQFYPVEYNTQHPDCDVNWDNEVNIADINLIIEYILTH